MSAAPAPLDRSLRAFTARFFAAALDPNSGQRVCAIVESSAAGFTGFSGAPGAGRGTVVEVAAVDPATLAELAPRVRATRPSEIGVFVRRDSRWASDDHWADALDQLRTLFGDLSIPVAVYREGTGS